MSTEQDQTSEAERFLASMAGDVTRIDTHAATVFLSADRAWKIKKPVKFPFLDFSTLAKREAAIRRELAINRPNAPAIYLGVKAIVLGLDSALQMVAAETLAPTQEPIEWVLEMARFDEAATLDHLAREPLSASLVDDLAGAVVAAETRAPVREAGPWIADLRDYIRQNDDAFRALPDLFPPEAVAALTAAAEAAFVAIAPLLTARGEAGFIRLTHGDLHTGNIAVIDGKPVLFDAIEFDDAIATGDILYDAAFLIMDLDERGRLNEANRFLNGWLMATARASGQGDAFVNALQTEAHGLAALPFFLMMRAAIRAKVTSAKAAYQSGATAAATRAEARRYFDLAIRDLEPVKPRLVAIGGLSGTGKSTLARALSPHIGRTPGALHLRSDQIRKGLAGVGEFERLRPESYTPEASRAVYAALAATVREALEAGWSVVIDTVAARANERAAFADLARSVGADFTGLWLEAPVDVLAARVNDRRHDASDADARVVELQAAYETGPIDWTHVDASGTEAETFERAWAALTTTSPPARAR
jgi:aminoglycoside phosphotransferase family enzyme/predicted kinase